MAIYVEFAGKKMYLHKSGSFYFFKPTKEGALDEVPEGYKIVYGKNGFPIVKKK